MTPRKALGLGTLVVGTLDILDALIFFGLRGVRPIRIFQAIAAGLLGRSSFEGGLATALLGGVLHYFIAFSIVGVYFLASRRAPVLTRHAVALGMLYGIVVYFVMSYVVIPLSAANQGPFSLPVFVNGILIHALGVGLPAALFAQAARRADAG
ncbi:MAG TPA: hypothetical protein VJ802_06860 [Gemmatimonadaceae bacterium]|nr:hypothetical protein [Gemmatimonadaceae bacterium]